MARWAARVAGLSAPNERQVTARYHYDLPRPDGPRMGEPPPAWPSYNGRMDGKLGHAVADSASPVRETAWT